MKPFSYRNVGMVKSDVERLHAVDIYMCMLSSISVNGKLYVYVLKI